MKKALLSDANFKYFTKTELNLDLAEIKISFNDLIILKALSQKFGQMNEVFESYMKNLDENLNKTRAAERIKTSHHDIECQ